MATNEDYIDISTPLSAATAVFPGDTPLSHSMDLDFTQGDNLRLSHINTGVHIGTHADAPSHYHPDGVSIDKRELHFYFGPTQVMEVRVKRGTRIYPKDFTQQKIMAPRVLLKTNSFPDSNHWNNDFNSLSPETIWMLKKQKVILIGIDTPSIDPFDDAKLLSHNEVYLADMAILEGLVLKEVNPGIYSLVALPLKIVGAEASPVRAILLKGKEIAQN